MEGPTKHCFLLQEAANRGLTGLQVASTDPNNQPSLSFTSPKCCFCYCTKTKTSTSTQRNSFTEVRSARKDDRAHYVHDFLPAQAIPNVTFVHYSQSQIFTCGESRRLPGRDSVNGDAERGGANEEQASRRE